MRVGQLLPPQQGTRPRRPPRARALMTDRWLLTLPRTQGAGTRTAPTETCLSGHCSPDLLGGLGQTWVRQRSWGGRRARFPCLPRSRSGLAACSEHLGVGGPYEKRPPAAGRLPHPCRRAFPRLPASVPFYHPLGRGTFRLSWLPVGDRHFQAKDSSLWWIVIYLESNATNYIPVKQFWVCLLCLQFAHWCLAAVEPPRAWLEPRADRSLCSRVLFPLPRSRVSTGRSDFIVGQICGLVYLKQRQWAFICPYWIFV